MLTKTLAAASLGVAILISVPQNAHAAQDPIYTGVFSNTAVQGHDVVAYFTEGAPVKGSSNFKTTHEGAEFRFASQENLDLFTANPDKYLPQYGGYCAWAMADGQFAKGDAKYWAIVDDKLYLNYNRSIQEKWNEDRSGFISSADAKWPDVLSE